MGKAFQIEKGHVYWLGEFTGTFFNDKGKGSLFDQAGVKCPANFDFDINNKKAKAGGYCVISDTSGDQAYLSWQNEGDGVTGPGTFHYTGGTGKYEGIKGDGTFVGVTQINWADAAHRADTLPGIGEQRPIRWQEELAGALLLEIDVGECGGPGRWEAAR